MTMHSVKSHRFLMVQRNRGRPPTTTDADRARGYQDAEGNYALGELKHWHIRVVDFMIANPAAKIVDIAKAFDVTPQWLGRLLKSDSFKEYYHQRISEHQDMVSIEIVSKMQRVAAVTLDHVAQKAEKGVLTPSEALDAADLALKGLGYIGKPGMHVNVKGGQGGNTSVTFVESDVVAKARAKMQLAMRENTAKAKHDPEGYTSVTAALDVTEDDIEDAEVVDDYRS